MASLEQRREAQKVAQLALCEALGLDPDTTAQVQLTVEPKRVVATWSGARRLSADEATDVMAAVSAALKDKL